MKKNIIKNKTYINDMIALHNTLVGIINTNISAALINNEASPEQLRKALKYQIDDKIRSKYD